jgi:hypothetical protein
VLNKHTTMEALDIAKFLSKVLKALEEIIVNSE